MDIKYLIHELTYGDSRVAMKMLFMHFYAKLMLFVSYFVKSKQDAEEIVSDTFYAIWEQRVKLATIQNITSYIYTVARNIAFDYLKRKEKTDSYIKPDVVEACFSVRSDFDPEDDLVGAELMERLRTAIDSLPEKSRIAFKLVREQGFKYKEAAEIMEISVKTLEAHMALATKRLMSILNEEIF